MNPNPNQSLEEGLRRAAASLPYPATPDIAGAVAHRLTTVPARPAWRGRRLAWGALVAIMVLLSLLAVPPVRAAFIQFIQIGAIRIFLGSPTATPTPTPTLPAPALAFTAASTPVPSITPTAITPDSLLNLAGETTLEQAQAGVNFPLKLPTYPADLGRPQHVYLQKMDGPLVVMVWLEPLQPEKVRLALIEFGPGTFAEKTNPESVENTTVNGHPALWLSGPYLFQYKNGDYNMQRLIQGHVLDWTGGQVTYHLETGEPLTIAQKMAESLR